MTDTLRGPIQHKTRTSAQWAAQNPVLLLGQIGYELDTDTFKIGNGAQRWNDIVTSFSKVNSPGVGGGIGSIETNIATLADLDALLTLAAANPANTYNAVLSALIPIATAKTITSNVYFKSLNGGRFTRTNVGGTLTFQGMGLVEPDSKIPIFEAFAVGDITWTGTTTDKLPYAVSTEIWNTGNDSLTDRVARADAAFPTQYMRIVCHPRTMTATVPLHQNRIFWFNEGDYLNTSNSGHSIFWGDSNIIYTGSKFARLHESTFDYNDMIIGIKNDALYDSYHDIHVIGLTFVGNLATAASAGSTAILGNTIRGSIQGCMFYQTKTYVTMGGAGDTGNYAEWSEISHNKFVRVPNQNAVIINGKNCRIADNDFELKGVYWTNPATGLQEATNITVIDAESNGEFDVIENLIVEDNRIDVRNIGSTFHNFFGGISVAGDGINRCITVRNNTFYSGNLENNGDNLGPGTLVNAVHFRGVLEGYIYNNTCRGAAVPIALTECNDVKVYVDTLQSSYDGYGDGNSISLRSCQDCDVYDTNVMRSKLTDPIYKSGIYEYEGFITVSTAAQLVTRQVLGTPGKFYPFMAGDSFIVNAALYHIEAVWSLPETESNTAKTQEVLPTLNTLAMVAADITGSTFHKDNHGHATGSRVQVVFTDFANRFLPDLTTNHPDGVVTAHIISVDANHFKLATTYANALAGTNIVITSPGTSAYTVYPVLQFQRSRNRYWNNRTLDGIVLSRTELQAMSDSVIYSTVGETVGGAAGPVAVPTIGGAPIIFNSGEDWVFMLERPAANGKYATSAEVRLQSVPAGYDRTFPIGESTLFRFPRLPFNVDATYRWRNSYRTGGSNGYSNYSAVAVAYCDADALENPPFSEYVAFANDPNDGSLT
jgi:hypothetical protein